VIGSSGHRVIEKHIPTLFRWPDGQMTRFVYRATIPLGPGGLVIVIGLLMAPVSVLTLKPEMLLDPLFDT
jgi:hypothetical protein